MVRYDEARVSATPTIHQRTYAPGVRLGRYTVVRRIGCGGMAELYLGRTEGAAGFVRPVALKVVHAHLVQDASYARMLIHEARLAATLDHPNIVQMLDVVEHHGEHMIVMEYVHGSDIAGLMARTAGLPLPLDVALHIALEVCQGLQHAHERPGPDGQPLGLVHRDVSPSNVLVGHNGAVKLTDFGIAKLPSQPSNTETGVLKGKFGYMSPEQCMGMPVDGRSDVFAVGVLLYEMTTGQRAFPGGNAFDVMNRVIEVEYDPPSAVVSGYPAALEAIVARAMAPEAEDRYQSFGQLDDELRRFADAAGVLPSAASLKQRMSEAFGEPAPPEVSTLVPIVPVTELVGRRPSAVRRARTRARVARASIALGAVLGLGAAVGWVAARDPGLQSPQAVGTSAPSTVAAPAQPHSDQPEPVEPVPDVVEPTPEVSPQPDASQDARPSNDRRRRRRSSGRSKRSGGAKSGGAQSGGAKSEVQAGAKSRDLDAMFPRSMQ